MLVFEYMQYILFRIVSYVQICCVCQFNETICYIMPEWRRYDFVVNQKLVVLFVRFDPYCIPSVKLKPEVDDYQSVITSKLILTDV